MKKLFSPLLYGCFALSTYSLPIAAQGLAAAGNPLKSNPAYLNGIINTNTAKTAIPIASMNTKVTRNFNKAHKDAQDVKWYNCDKGYLAEFNWAGVKSHAFYGKHGGWYGDVRYGKEKDLPAMDRKIIKSNYVDYSIGSAVEVNLGGNQHAWVVNLQDADNLVQARIMDGSLDEMAHYQTHEPAKKRKAHIVIPK